MICRGYGFVKFPTIEACKDVFSKFRQDPSTPLKGRRIAVDVAREPKQKVE